MNHKNSFKFEKRTKIFNSFYHKTFSLTKYPTNRHKNKFFIFIFLISSFLLYLTVPHRIKMSHIHYMIASKLPVNIVGNTYQIKFSCTQYCDFEYYVLVCYIWLKKCNLLKRKNVWLFNVMQIASLMGKKKINVYTNIKRGSYRSKYIARRIYTKIATANIPSNNMNVKSVNKTCFFFYFISRSSDTFVTITIYL